MLVARVARGSLEGGDDGRPSARSRIRSRHGCRILRAVVTAFEPRPKAEATPRQPPCKGWAAGWGCQWCGLRSRRDHHHAPAIADRPATSRTSLGVTADRLRLLAVFTARATHA